MPVASLCKFVTRQVVKVVTKDESIARLVSNQVGARVAVATLDFTYPVIQGGKAILRATAGEEASKVYSIVSGVTSGVSLLENGFDSFDSESSFESDIDDSETTV